MLGDETEQSLMLQERNDVLMNVIEEVDHLLQWGKVYEARMLLQDHINDEEQYENG